MSKLQITLLGYVCMFSGYIAHLFNYRLTGLFAFGLALGFFTKALMVVRNEKK